MSQSVHDGMITSSQAFLLDLYKQKSTCLTPKFGLPFVDAMVRIFVADQQTQTGDEHFCHRRPCSGAPLLSLLHDNSVCGGNFYALPRLPRMSTTW